MISFDSSQTPYEVKTVIFILQMKSLRPREVNDEAKVVWIMNGITGVKIQVCVISKTKLVLGSIFSFALTNITLGATVRDVRISLFPSLQGQLKSYSIHILFLSFLSYDLLFKYGTCYLFYKNQIQYWLYSKGFINPPSLSKVNEKRSQSSNLCKVK